MPPTRYRCRHRRSTWGSRRDMVLLLLPALPPLLQLVSLLLLFLLILPHQPLHTTGIMRRPRQLGRRDWRTWRKGMTR